jgi:hypothetical protein
MLSIHTLNSHLLEPTALPVHYASHCNRLPCCLVVQFGTSTGEVAEWLRRQTRIICPQIFQPSVGFARVGSNPALVAD